MANEEFVSFYFELSVVSLGEGANPIVLIANIFEISTSTYFSSF